MTWDTSSCCVLIPGLIPNIIQTVHYLELDVNNDIDQNQVDQGIGSLNQMILLHTFEIGFDVIFTE